MNASTTIFCLPILYSSLAAGWNWQNPYPQANDLQDVCFSDSLHGWAVGRYSAIYHTTDGGGMVGIGAQAALPPADFHLAQNYPNSFNPVTTIEYQVEKSGSVKLAVYDLLGREVKTLVNERKPAGSYTV